MGRTLGTERQTCPLSFTVPLASFTLSCSSPSHPFLILGECGSLPSLKSALLFLRKVQDLISSLEKRIFIRVPFWLHMVSLPLASDLCMRLLMAVCVCVLVIQSCLTLCDPVDCSPPGSSVHGPGVGSHSLPQGIFPTQGSNPGLPYCWRILSCLSLPGVTHLRASPQMRGALWAGEEPGAGSVALSVHSFVYSCNQQMSIEHVQGRSSCSPSAVRTQWGNGGSSDLPLLPRRTQEFCEEFGAWVTVRRVVDTFSFSVPGLIGN